MTIYEYQPTLPTIGRNATHTSRVPNVVSAWASAATDGANIALMHVEQRPTDGATVTQAIELCDSYPCQCGCGVLISDPHNRGRKYASNACKQRAYYRRRGAVDRVCIVCDQAFTTAANERICSAECRQAWRDYRTSIGRTVGE